MAGINDLTGDIAKKFNMEPKQAREILDYIGHNISSRLGLGENVYWKGFGTFKLTQIKARVIRNPVSGNEMHLDRTLRVLFNPTLDTKNTIRKAFGLPLLEDKNKKRLEKKKALENS